jgi:hydroxymethylbilane synthase
MALSSLKIGTRGSPLALRQTEIVEEKLRAHYPALAIERVIITTSGDWKPEQGETRLAEEQGGKGLFAKEIEDALLSGAIDCAVHSMKDMDSNPPEGLALDHVLEREDPRDALICHTAKSIFDLPGGAVVGTSSVRRQAILLAQRPDLKVVPLRGNVHTRLEKLKDGQVDATFLAMAGLNRLGITGDFIHPLKIETMMPACGQGIVTIETREEDDEVRKILDSIHHEATGLCAAVERAALQYLDGSCRSAICAYARPMGRMFRVDVHVGHPEGGIIYKMYDLAYISTQFEAVDIGIKVAEKLKKILPAGILS